MEGGDAGDVGAFVPRMERKAGQDNRDRREARKRKATSEAMLRDHLQGFPFVLLSCGIPKGKKDAYGE